MTEHRPDTDDRGEPGGTPTASAGNLTDRPVTPGDDDTRPSSVPGAYAADDEDRERAVEPGT